MKYAELHCLSNFSFLRGASHPQELVERAAALGYEALAVTDECSVAGVVRAHEAARDCGLKLIIGAEFRLADGPKIVLLAANREGYGNLCELITRGRRRADKGRYELFRSDMAGGVPGCLALLIPGATVAADPDGNCGALEEADWFARCFGPRAWLAVELLYGSSDRTRLRQLRSLARSAALPMAAAGDVHMHVRSRRRLQDTLTAIRLGIPVAECGAALHPNAERHLRLRVRLAQIYPQPLLEETVRIASRCAFSLDELRYEYPDEIVPAGETVTTYLRKLVERGLQWRYGHAVPARVCEQIEHELSLIARLRYEPYFLTVYDIVRFAREQSILCQGRGSAANSAVCYAIGITEVDPARSSLLFERFISEERNEPPDI
ncbi:MAG TPA: PHP domain-containing protein, partial [Steroidobacteraceae bacterium]|nr:PHP domain-containing protein [Steroidobacteraceae bacterium]